MKKIPGDKLFVQVTYKDILTKLWLISLFRVNCEVYISAGEINEIDEARIARIAGSLRKRRISVRVHAPVCDFLEEGSAGCRELFKKTLRLCSVLGADAVVIHPEYEKRKYADMGAWITRTADIWKYIAGSAREAGITALLENHHEPSADIVIRILNLVSGSGFGVCYDVGHFNAFGEKGASEYLDDYPRGSIQEFHLSDNLQDHDAHLPLGKGNIDFVKFFTVIDRIGINPVFTIEAKNIVGIITGMRYLRRIGRL